MIERTDKLNQIKSGFDRSPIVSITGLRQSGKTTLAKDFASQYQGSCTHFDLEDPRSLARLSEPMTALENLSGLVVIDEVQRLPEPLCKRKQIKKGVHRIRRIKEINIFDSK